MNPINKFTNIDAVYPITDAKEEDTLLDYVWELAMLIHPALPKKVKGGALEGSEALPTFKERYNNRLIKMPLTYEEYKKNKEIQPTLAGLEIDSDKFWFLLLFIWDYTQGQCFNAQELAPSPIGELNSFIRLLSQYKAVGENPLTDQMTLSKILCKWKQDSAVSLFLYLNSVFKNKHKLIHNQAPVMNRLCPFLLNLHK